MYLVVFNVFMLSIVKKKNTYKMQYYNIELLKQHSVSKVSWGFILQKYDKIVVLIHILRFNYENNKRKFKIYFL